MPLLRKWLHQSMPSVVPQTLHTPRGMMDRGFRFLASCRLRSARLRHRSEQNRFELLIARNGALQCSQVASSTSAPPECWPDPGPFQRCRGHFVSFGHFCMTMQDALPLVGKCAEGAWVLEGVPNLKVQVRRSRVHAVDVCDHSGWCPVCMIMQDQ